MPIFWRDDIEQKAWKIAKERVPGNRKPSRRHRDDIEQKAWKIAKERVPGNRHPSRRHPMQLFEE